MSLSEQQDLHGVIDNLMTDVERLRGELIKLAVNTVYGWFEDAVMHVDAVDGVRPLFVVMPQPHTFFSVDLSFEVIPETYRRNVRALLRVTGEDNEVVVNCPNIVPIDVTAYEQQFKAAATALVTPYFAQA
jgi:hypothetical protein